jgi:ethylbenzene dioxygenase beta subunit
MNANVQVELSLSESQALELGQVHRIEQFLFFEARLLDSERWADWLALMTPDIHYWMPAIENRRRADRLGAYGPGRGAYFDDCHLDLGRRVARFMQPSAWAEDPPTRHVHVISNVEAYCTNVEDEYAVHSVFVNYRSRGETDNDLLFGRREDILRQVNGDLRIARRKIVITQSLLMSKNINTFF